MKKIEQNQVPQTFNKRILNSIRSSSNQEQIEHITLHIYYYLTLHTYIKLRFFEECSFLI